MARQLDPTKRKLTDIQCKSAKPSRDENGSTKPIKLSDGYGLNLKSAVMASSGFMPSGSMVSNSSSI